MRLGDAAEDAGAFEPWLAAAKSGVGKVLQRHGHRQRESRRTWQRIGLDGRSASRKNALHSRDSTPREYTLTKPSNCLTKQDHLKASCGRNGTVGRGASGARSGGPLRCRRRRGCADVLGNGGQPGLGERFPSWFDSHRDGERGRRGRRRDGDGDRHGRGRRDRDAALRRDDLATPARQLARMALDAGATRRRCVVSLATFGTCLDGLPHDLTCSPAADAKRPCDAGGRHQRHLGRRRQRSLERDPRCGTCISGASEQHSRCA